MSPIEAELADLRRRIVKLNRDELMRLVESVIADVRADRAHGDARLRGELELLAAHEQAQRPGGGVSPERAA